MKKIGQFLRSQEITSRPGFQEELWSVVAQNYKGDQSQKLHPLAFWKQLFAGSVVVFGLSLLITSHIVSQRQLHTKLHNFDIELSWMEQDILNDPVINEALATTQ